MSIVPTLLMHHKNFRLKNNNILVEDEQNEELNQTLNRESYKYNCSNPTLEEIEENLSDVSFEHLEK